MNYPLISEYVEAIRYAEENFATLTNLRPIFDNEGKPVMSSGNYAVVFKMRDKQTGKVYAVKCFLKNQEGREESYPLISEELSKTNSPYILSAEYINQELFVDTNQSDNKEFPVLVMEWVEGETLSSFLSLMSQADGDSDIWSPEECDHAFYELRCLPSNFIRMASWLIKQPFAHGDLKPDNIIVKPDGTCVLVDYDGMYVPSMQGMKKHHLGTPNFMHPFRPNQIICKDIDNYAISIIALSLYVFSLKPETIENSKDYCIITEKEACKLHEHWIFKDEELMSDASFQELLTIYLHTLSQNKITKDYYDLCVSEFLCPCNYDIFLTKATEYEMQHAWEDNYGVKYSLDGKKVLSASNDLAGEDYIIREGVITICDQAFQGKNLKSIKLPDSVVAIGDRAFANNDDMVYCNIPSSVRFIYENNPWGGCFNIKKMDCYSPLYQIKDGILYSSDYSTVYGFIYRSPEVCIDFRTKKISANAFWSSRKGHDSFIKKVTLDNVTEVGKSAFSVCTSAEFVINGRIKELGRESFYRCELLETIDLSNVEEIPEKAFIYCKNLTSVSFSPELNTIHSKAFQGCESLETMDIPDSVSFISDDAFIGCLGLCALNVDSDNQDYCSVDGILYNKSLTKLIKFPPGKQINEFIIPDTVFEIGDGAFKNCTTLQTIICNNKILKFGKGVFDDCKCLNNCKIYLDERTDSESALNLGRFLFSLKNSTDEIKQNGYSLLFKAAELNNPDAQWILARCFKYGWNGETNIEKYIQWLKRSAINKNYSAMLALAREFLSGKNTPKDYKQAYELLCALEDADIIAELICNGEFFTLLGICFEFGLGVAKNTKKSAEYYKKGADWGDSAAEFSLARCFENGIGLSINLQKAKEYYLKAKQHDFNGATEALERVEMKINQQYDDLPF